MSGGGKSRSTWRERKRGKHQIHGHVVCKAGADTVATEATFTGKEREQADVFWTKFLGKRWKKSNGSDWQKQRKNRMARGAIFGWKEGVGPIPKAKGLGEKRHQVVN